MILVDICRAPAGALQISWCLEAIKRQNETFGPGYLTELGKATKATKQRIQNWLKRPASEGPSYTTAVRVIDFLRTRDRLLFDAFTHTDLKTERKKRKMKREIEERVLRLKIEKLGLPSSTSRLSV